MASSQERWGRPASAPIGSEIDAHLDRVLAPHAPDVAPPAAPAPARSAVRRASATTRVPRVPRSIPYQPIVERVVPTYLAFESSARLNEYLIARSFLAERTRP
jgi:hypothetical protein